MKWVGIFLVLFVLGCSQSQPSESSKTTEPPQPSRPEDGAVQIKANVEGPGIEQVKKDLSVFFQKYPAVQRAYLVRGLSEDKKEIVACLIELDKGDVNTNLRTAVIDIFLHVKGPTFRTLHVVTVRDTMRSDLAAKATAFYQKS